MRTRAYRPEVSGCLEGRLLLSGVAGRPAAPYVLTGRQFKSFVVHLDAEFDIFRHTKDGSHLIDGLKNLIPLIPFARADGLPAKLNHIVDQMGRDIHANVPQPVRTAANEILAVTRAELEARVQAGDVVLR